MPYIGKKPADIIATAVDTTTGTFSGDIDVDGTTNLDVVDVDGAVNFAADVTFADGADIITASAGTSNFRAGVNAGNSIESGGNYNVLVGDEAGTAISTGDNNTLIGYAAGDALTTGSHNTFVGENAGTATTGSNNTGIGRHALTANTSGVNTAVGYTALDANTTGTSNVAVGDAALGGNVAGDQSVAIGTEALLVQNPSGNADMNNVAVGYRSGYAVTTGVENTLIGGLAGDAITTGNNNTAMGHNSLSTNILSDHNVAIGNDALATHNTGSSIDAYNVAVGSGAGFAVTTGVQNTFIGGNAGDANTTSNNNTAVGYQSLFANTTGATNTAVGDSALQSVTTGSGNVGVGQASGGQGAMINITTESNRAVFGHNSITNAYVKVAFTVTSDARDKMNFEEVPHGLSFVNQLKPVKFNFKKSRENATPHGRTKYGFKAQDILALEGDNPIIIDDENEDSLKAVESHLLPVLTKAIQELSAQVTALTARLTTLEG
jgi:hypothetical protein